MQARSAETSDKIKMIEVLIVQKLSENGNKNSDMCNLL
jgi:hypothetical protein